MQDIFFQNNSSLPVDKKVQEKLDKNEAKVRNIEIRYFSM